MNHILPPNRSRAAALSPADARLLAEVALAAVQQGHGEKALPILDALDHETPDHPIAAVGRALLALHGGQADEAVRILEREALGKRHGRVPVQGLLLMALSAGRRYGEAARLLDTILAGPDSASRRLATTLGTAIRQRAGQPIRP
jgi:predicted Zn-dependent protease